MATLGTPINSQKTTKRQKKCLRNEAKQKNEKNTEVAIRYPRARSDFSPSSPRPPPISKEQFAMQRPSLKSASRQTEVPLFRQNRVFLQKYTKKDPFWDPQKLQQTEKH